jgi:hypothetical protein
VGKSTIAAFLSRMACLRGMFPKAPPFGLELRFQARLFSFKASGQTESQSLGTYSYKMSEIRPMGDLTQQPRSRGLKHLSQTQSRRDRPEHLHLRYVGVDPIVDSQLRCSILETSMPKESP